MTPEAKDERASAAVDARRRAGGCLSVLLMVAAVPGILVGILIYLNSRDSADSHSGTGGALSGLGELVGIGVIAASAIAFLVGSHVRSARD